MAGSPENISLKVLAVTTTVPFATKSRNLIILDTTNLAIDEVASRRLKCIKAIGIKQNCFVFDYRAHILPIYQLECPPAGRNGAGMSAECIR